PQKDEKAEDCCEEDPERVAVEQHAKRPTRVELAPLFPEVGRTITSCRMRGRESGRGGCVSAARRVRLGGGAGCTLAGAAGRPLVASRAGPGRDGSAPSAPTKPPVRGVYHSFSTSDARGL